MKKQALGRGLSALIDTEIKTDGSSSINEIAIEQIHANPNQPRTFFDEEALNELATSIRELGIISPITLREIGTESYEIIAGERRYRAAKMVGLEKIPAYIKTADDEKVMAMALIENIQREDLNAIEIALSYHKLITDCNLTQEQLSERVGKKRATIANYLRLLKLPAEVQMGIKDRRIEMGHARALAGLSEPAAQVKLYEEVVANGYSVRQTEEKVQNFVANATNGKRPIKHTGTPLTEQHKVYKNDLSQKLNTRVDFVCSKNGKTKITIHLASDDELKRVMGLLS